MKQVYADFNEVDADGSLDLRCAGSVVSIAELKMEPREAEEVCFTDGEMFAVGRVHRRADGTWEGRSTWEFVHLPPPGLDEPGETVRQALLSQTLLLPDAPAVDDPRPYQPRPPLWRSFQKEGGSPWRIAVGTLIALGLAGAFAAVVFELHLFSGPATATPVTITAVERITPGDESPPHIVYVVKLPDGGTARFTSERVYRPGTRLTAMVARGGITGRTLVGPPYVVMPDE
jgi:hypothetical protein